MKRVLLGLLLAAGSSLALGGCLAKNAVDVVTLPVKVTSKAVDLATTSQAEADEKRGRQIRKREEQLGRLQRDHEKLARKCQTGDRKACDDDRAVSAQIAQLMPSVPLERR
jgi:hypothetical protein